MPIFPRADTPSDEGRLRNEAGYRDWAEAMEPAIRKFLGEISYRERNALSQKCVPGHDLS
jgi:hypothetical protein